MSEAEPAEPTPVPKTCGIVMPISKIDDCGPEHWLEVKEILSEAIEAAGFTPRLVSDAPDSGIIHKRIVENLYRDPMVVVDVSAKNPNVMFELGLRLAFDKPTIIVKDNRTDYSFDTSPIEHVGYPRDLRHKAIITFKTVLTEKIKGTAEQAKDPDYSTFVKHVGPFLSVAKIETKEVGRDELILERLSELTLEVQRMSREVCEEPMAPVFRLYFSGEVAERMTFHDVKDRLRPCGLLHFAKVSDNKLDVAMESINSDITMTGLLKNLGINNVIVKPSPVGQVVIK
jgi:hypothetical protein